MPIWYIWHLIRRYFKKIKVGPEYIFTVKEMEDNGIVGACTEHALLTATIFRRLGYPTAIVHSIYISSLFQHPTGYEAESGHAVNLVYYDGSWWLYDSASAIPYSTKFIFTTFLQKGLIPGIIIRDPADINIKNRYDTYYYVLYNVKDVLLLDLQEDIIDQIKLLKLRSYIKQFEEQPKQ